jgi:hemoglobin
LAQSGRHGRTTSRSRAIHEHQHDADRTTSAARTDITSAADVHALLVTFYEAALLDPLLGPVFATAGMRLDTHLPRIAAFWQVTLLGTGTYSGSPLALHRRAAAASGLGQAHFDRWLLLWERTVRSMFTGPTATRAVSEAQRMAVGMLRDLDRHPPTAEGAASTVTGLRIVSGAPEASS